MKGIFIDLLGKLFGWGKTSTSDDRSSAGISALPVSRGNDVTRRYKSILRYWIDSELFDLPVCPPPKDTTLYALEKFKAEWGKVANKQLREGTLKLTDESRLVIMFQCHYAGYLAKPSEQHPNQITPKTYLYSQAMVPVWDGERLLWKCSEELQDQVINLAAIRALYRRCHSAVPSGMSLHDWVKARCDDIETLINRELSGSEGEMLDTDALYEKVNTVNREIASQFWPDQAAYEFMLNNTQPVDTGYDTKTYTAVCRKDSSITYRWRFCFYPEGSETTQLGPFFIRDLERLLDKVSEEGAAGLSAPLNRYLSGQPDRTFIDNALNNGEFFYKHTNALVYGRWPENPAYGLSLLQTFAVNTAIQRGEPVVAVNGPPGTGKTTLLKDVIAERFVARTAVLASLSDNADWLEDARTIEAVLSNSMLVASSNNKAVENISAELPDLSKVHTQYQGAIRHFKGVAGDDSWGLFCAILGKKANRDAFKTVLAKLQSHLKGLQDPFLLNDLIRQLEKAEADQRATLITRFVTGWKNKDQLLLLVADIEKTHAYKKHQPFFKVFCQRLNNVVMEFNEPEHVGELWQETDQSVQVSYFEALNDFKRQWFRRGLGKARIQQTLQDAKQDFADCYKRVGDVAQDFSIAKYDPILHLTSPGAYHRLAGESDQTAEQRLQQSAPLGSQSLNDCRSRLFIAALRLNEALLESVATELKAYFDDLPQLIDGRLETAEQVPEHQQLWAILFLFFPVVSSSLSSVENQFKLMQRKEGFGLAMIDEAGQAVNYHVAGLLQRCRQVIFVGDPIQLEPVVTIPPSIDRDIGSDFMNISSVDGEKAWGDSFLISANSAQEVADRASSFYSLINGREVGIPLLVHRRCVEPMFSIANHIAYGDRMVLATLPAPPAPLQSGWVHIAEQASDITTEGYANTAEVNAAFRLIHFIVNQHPDMAKNGIYIITPFTKMSHLLRQRWKKMAKDDQHKSWMKKAYATAERNRPVKEFADTNIGTVHTFQGKEAGIVILCLAASRARKKQGGITWVNSKPNLLNVAATRAKHHLFVLGNSHDWAQGAFSSAFHRYDMKRYNGLKDLIGQRVKPISDGSRSIEQEHMVDTVSESIKEL